jgi:hypothetical protein
LHSAEDNWIGRIELEHWWLFYLREPDKMKIFENFIADLVLTDCKNNLFSKIGLILENSCENQNRMVLKIW